MGSYDRGPGIGTRQIAARAHVGQKRGKVPQLLRAVLTAAESARSSGRFRCLMRQVIGAAARVSFENTRGVHLGLGPRDVAPFIHPIEDERVSGDLWRLSRQELLDQTGRIVKEVMDRVFLAAGLTNGTWHIDDEGNWVA